MRGRRWGVITKPAGEESMMKRLKKIFRSTDDSPEPSGPAEPVDSSNIYYFPGQDADDLTMAGWNLSARKARALEKQVRENPNDVTDLTILLGYYFGKECRSRAARTRRQKHILWLIENMPEADVLALPEGHFLEASEPEAYLKGKKIWLEQIEKNPGSFRILGHSANYLFLSDRELAERSFRKAMLVDPENPWWPHSLAHLYSFGKWNKSASERRDSAGKALEQLEKAYNLFPDEAKNYILRDLAKTAYEAEEIKKAKRFAEKMLDSDIERWDIDRDINHGNDILGRIALGVGEIEKAKDHLIAAGSTRGAPPLGWFGPSMSLAKELLEAGEKDSVLQYLELCSRSWKRSRKKTKKWARAINKGKIPDLDASLYS
jgi:tetratricopeptide (TPR) repeat protein